MKYTKTFPHPDAGKLIIGTISNCCNTSVSVNFGTDKKPFHHTCNKCKKECQTIRRPMWEVTAQGKYKNLQG